eukprot:scaffold30.g4441.t1
MVVANSAPAAGARAGSASSNGTHSDLERMGALVLLTAGGALLHLPCPGRAVLDQQRAWRPTLQQLESNMEELLGRIAELSAAQQAQQARLLALDRQLAAVSASIPAVQAIRCATHGLHCAVRPLHLLAAAVGTAGSGAAAAWGGLSVKVEVRNDSRVALVGWSLAVLYAGSSAGGISTAGSSSALVHACPLGALPPGAAWQWPCHLAADWLGRGQLLVLLCHEGSAAADSSSTSDDEAPRRSGEGSLALLHFVELDGLHFLDSAGSSASAALQARLPLSARLLLQVPRAAGGGPPAAADVLDRLLRQGLCTVPQRQQDASALEQLPALTLATAFSLVRPAAGLSSRAAGALSSSRQGALALGGAAAPVGLRTSQLRGGTAGAALVEVGAAAASQSALLEAHAGLVQRLLLQAAAAEHEQQAGGSGGIPMPSGRVQVPPRGSVDLAAAAEESALEEALLQLRAAKQQAMALRDAAHHAQRQEQEWEENSSWGRHDEQEAQEEAASSAASVEHRARQRRLEQMWDIVLAARQAVAGVPVAL